MIVNHDGPFICDKCGEELIDRVAFFEHLDQKKNIWVLKNSFGGFIE